MAGQSSHDAGSQVVWLFGHPVGHSLSALLQNAAFRHDGVPLTYVARDVQPHELPGAVNELRKPRSRGANLTLPHKVAAIPLLDEVDEEAARTGAVNTVVNQAGRLTGHNTDIEGFLKALRTALPEGAEGAEFLVLGAGGAARAVLAALQRDGATTIWVANRTQERAAGLCEEASDWGEAKCVPVSLDALDDAARRCRVIVNATSLGLPGRVKESAIDVDTLQSGQVLFDLVYGTGPTALVQAARGRGLVAIDGKEMLLQQAALSYGLWTGREAPLEVMRGSISDS